MTHGYGASARAAGDRSSAGGFRTGLSVLLALCLGGVVVGAGIHQIDDATIRLASGAASAVLFRDQDLPWFALCIVIVAYIRGAMNSPLPNGIAELVRRYAPEEARPVRHAVAIALATLVLVGLGAFVLYHAADKTIAENAARFQAEVFRQGRPLAQLPDEWAEYADAMHPGAVFHDDASGLWGTVHGPLFAGLRAAYSLVGLGSASNGVFTALSVLLIAAIGRRLWPDRIDAPIIAAALLATSPQFLMTGMTASPWAAVLCLNLAWLWCFLRDDRAGHLLAALIGIAAAGLHQIHGHALFVLPFMLVMLRDRRWLLAAFYVSAYGAGHLAWLYWPDFAIAATMGADAKPSTDIGLDAAIAALSQISVPGPVRLSVMGLDLLRLIGWLNLIVVPLIFMALRRWSRLPAVFRLLAAGVPIAILPALLFASDPFPGWGYLPVHGHLGSLVLLATLGWVRVTTDRPQIRPELNRAAGLFCAAMLLVALPLRAYQMERFTAPTAASVRYIQAIDSDVVLVDQAGIWFGAELIRNDPFLRERPKVMRLQSLTSGQIEALCAAYSVAVVDYHDLAEFGMARVDANRPGRYELTGSDRALRAIATSPRCTGD